MKITALELANIKRIKALRLEPTSSGLTIVGGSNAQGKSTVLHAVAYAFGGENYRPTQLKR
jgi:recombinational DNA repair ATPase RecF